MAVTRDAAIFVDRDGTLLDAVPYNADPDRIHVATRVRDGLRRLHGRGFRVIVVTNQPGLAHGTSSDLDLRIVEQRLRDLLRIHGVPLTGFYYCPHDPEGRVGRYGVSCTCRKPRPGLFQRAARDHAISLSRSWCIGDTLDHVEAGHNAGARSILIDNGNEIAWTLSASRIPDYLAHDFRDAARHIIDTSDPGRPTRPTRIAPA